MNSYFKGFEALKPIVVEYNAKKQGYAVVDDMLTKVKGFSKHCFAQNKGYTKKNDLIWDIITEASGDQVESTEYKYGA